jgi:RNA polymerase sigma-70 factor (ECF subfamily)
MAQDASSSSVLADAFLAALPGVPGREVGPREELEGRLCQAIQAFRADHPAVRLDEVACAAALAEAAPTDGLPADWLDTARTSDLLLARACADGESHALAIFERDHMRLVPAFVAHLDRSTSFADEVKQTLREKLLVGVGGAAPKITDYRGAGPLGGWLRVAAVRLALNLKRTDVRRLERTAAGDRDAVGERRADAPPSDPERLHLKRLLGDDFRRALEETLSALPRDERVVLRMHYLDGLSIDELAPLHGVHRATVARWIDRARKRILDGTRERLCHRLGGAVSHDIDSIVRLVRSELDVSVARFLRETVPGAKARE